MPPQRARWMDFTRGIFILLVIILHTSVILASKDLDVPEPLRVFNLSFQPFRMALLMFLSGMLLERSLSKSTGGYIGGKLRQIYWPFLIWSMVALVVEDRFTLEAVLKTPISAPTFLWYLWFICAYYMIALVLNRFRVPLVPVMLISLAGAYVLPDFLRASRFAYLFVFFMFGHYVASGRITMTGRTPLAGLGLALAVAVSMLNVGGFRTTYNPLYAWGPIGLILFVLWLSNFYRPGMVGDGLEWVGRNSIVFYVSHLPAQILIVEALSTTSGFGPYLNYLVVVSASFAVGAALQALRSRSDLIAGLFDFGKLQDVLVRFREGAVSR